MGVSFVIRHSSFVQSIQYPQNVNVLNKCLKLPKIGEVKEDLAVKNMVKNHCLAKAISQVGWGQFCTLLKYKAQQEGKVYQEVDRFFPSSKTCHVCLNQVSRLPLDVREWTCSNCGTRHDRDINAAINLKDEGLRILSLTCGTRDKAYRQTVRRSNRGRIQSTTTRVSG